MGRERSIMQGHEEEEKEGLVFIEERNGILKYR